MGNAAKLAKRTPVRACIVGFPGSGKTGLLVALANAGYKLRVLDFDGNPEPLLRFTQPDKLDNIDIQNLEDKLRSGARFIEPDGIPSAFTRGLKLMDHWKYKDDDGTEVDLGRSKDWGCDTVVVLDSLTSMGKASMRRIESILNKTPANRTQQVWGIAAGEQEDFIEKLTASSNRFHVIVLAHLKMVGPKDVVNTDSDLTKELKERAGDLIQTRYYPSAIGWALPQTIAQHFPTLLSMEKSFKQSGAVSRVLKSVPRQDLDLKVPAPNIPGELPLEDGLLKVFEALTAPLSECQSSESPQPDEAATKGEAR